MSAARKARRAAGVKGPGPRKQSWGPNRHERRRHTVLMVRAVKAAAVVRAVYLAKVWRKACALFRIGVNAQAENDCAELSCHGDTFT